jgi:AAR2 protein
LASLIIMRSFTSISLLHNNLVGVKIFSYKKWVSLTEYITPILLEHILPLNGKIWSATPLQSESSTTESRRAAAASNQNPELLSSPAESSRRHRAIFRDGMDDDDPRLPHMPPIPGSQIRFTNIAGWNVVPIGSSGAEITRLGMDHTEILRAAIKSYPPELNVEQAVLGELQFAFVCFLIGQVMLIISLPCRLSCSVLIIFNVSRTYGNCRYRIAMYSLEFYIFWVLPYLHLSL